MDVLEKLIAPDLYRPQAHIGTTSIPFPPDTAEVAGNGRPLMSAALVAQ